MLVEDTELEYNNADGVALDYFLGGRGEDKHAWAKRVWDKCAEYKETNGLGRDGKGMPSVYAEDPKFLWEQKKRRRRIALVQIIQNKSDDKHLAETKRVKDDLKQGKGPEWSFDFADAQVEELKNNVSYKTRAQQEAENDSEELVAAQAIQNERLANVEALRAKGFDDETIKIIYPASASVI